MTEEVASQLVLFLAGQLATEAERLRAIIGLSFVITTALFLAFGWTVLEDET